MKDNWFQHDQHTLLDTKISAMTTDCGLLGYGIYWYFVETLHMTNDNKIDISDESIKNVLFNRYKVSPDDLEKFIISSVKYGLFKRDGSLIWSNRVLDNVKKLKLSVEELSKIRSENGKKGAAAKNKKKGDSAEEFLK